MNLLHSSTVPIKDSIVTHLLKVVFSLYFLVALGTTVTHLIAEYYNAKNQVVQDLQIFQQTVEQGLSQTIYDFNHDQLKSIVSGLLKVPIIVGITIQDAGEEILIDIGRTSHRAEKMLTTPQESQEMVEQMQGMLEETFSELVEHRFPIIHTYEDGETDSIGIATFYSSHSIVLQKVQYGFLFIFVNAMIKTIALWVIFVLVTRAILSNPLLKLTSATEKLNFDNLEETPIDIKIKHRNELKILEEAFNTMLQKLGSARKALEEINFRLEEKVQARTYDLEQSNKELEQKYIELQASDKKFEELGETKKQFLEKMNLLGETYFPSLKQKLTDLVSTPTIHFDSKTLVHQAIHNMTSIEDTLSPFRSLYLSEQAIRSKRVLLAETHKKHQIIAKMALGGTGVELDIVSDLETGESYLDKYTYDIICTGIELIELTQKAVEKYPQIQSVFMTSEDISSYLSLLQQYPFLSNIVARNEEDRTFTLKNITTTVSKLITQNFFGLEKYLNWGVDVQQYTIMSSELRGELLDSMKSYFQQLGVRRPIIQKSVMVAEELLMNAIYDAPVDENGKARYNHLPRTIPVELQPAEQGLFRYACDGILLAISVEDPFGVFHRETILEYLESNYEGRAGTLQHQKGGAGRGIFQIIQTSDLVVFTVKPKVRTEVIVIFNIDPNMAKSKKTHSFHYFST